MKTHVGNTIDLSIHIVYFWTVQLKKLITVAADVYRRVSDEIIINYVCFPPPLEHRRRRQPATY